MLWQNFFLYFSHCLSIRSVYTRIEEPPPPSLISLHAVAFWIWKCVRSTLYAIDSGKICHTCRWLSRSQDRYYLFHRLAWCPCLCIYLPKNGRFIVSRTPCDGFRIDYPRYPIYRESTFFLHTTESISVFYKSSARERVFVHVWVCGSIE